MNKFVKGAKNLAFALSFVTIAACGKGKEIEDLKKQVETCKNDASEAQASVKSLKTEVSGCAKTGEMKTVQGEIENLKNGTAILDSLNNCKDKEILSKLFGNEALKKFEVFKGYDYKLIFAVDGENFALEVMLNGKKDNGLSVANNSFSTVEGNAEFKVCENFGFEGKCFVKDGDEKSKLSVTAAESDATKLKVGGNDVKIKEAVKILTKAKGLGVDVKKLFKVDDFKGGKLFNVGVNGVTGAVLKPLILLICEDAEAVGKISEGTDLKFKFNGTDCSLTVTGTWE